MNLRNLAIWGVIVVALIAVYSVMTNSARGGGSHQVSYSEFLAKVDNGDVKNVKINGQRIQAQDRQGATLTANGPMETGDLQHRLELHGAAYDFEPAGGGLLPTILINMLPILVLVGVWIFVMR